MFSIVIDNKQTKAQRIAPDKVQLDIVALPLDEQNDAEPNLDLRLYVNGELFQNLQSNSEGTIKESYVLSHMGSEHLMIKIEDVVHGVQSKLKCVMIQE
jgi:hypothetical protein